MTSPVKFVYEDDLLFHAVGKMRKLNLHHLPVFDMSLKILGMIDMNTALQAELGDVVNQIDNMTYDEQDASGLIKIKQQQVILAENMLDRNVYPGDISYLLSFLNNVIYRRAIRLAEKRVAEKNIIKNIPNFSVIVMGSGGRMESFLHPDRTINFKFCVFKKRLDLFLRNKAIRKGQEPGLLRGPVSHSTTHGFTNS